MLSSALSNMAAWQRACIWPPHPKPCRCTHVQHRHHLILSWHRHLLQPNHGMGYFCYIEQQRRRRQLGAVLTFGTRALIPHGSIRKEYPILETSRSSFLSSISMAVCMSWVAPRQQHWCETLLRTARSPTSTHTWHVFAGPNTG